MCRHVIPTSHTVLVQIFEGRIFHECHKFSIFAILFSRITGFRHSVISMLHIIIVNFRGLNFRGPHVIRENSEIYVPRKFVRVRYRILQIFQGGKVSRLQDSTVICWKTFAVGPS